MNTTKAWEKRRIEMIPPLFFIFTFCSARGLLRVYIFYAIIWILLTSELLCINIEHKKSPRRIEHHHQANSIFRWKSDSNKAIKIGIGLAKCRIVYSIYGSNTDVVSPSPPPPPNKRLLFQFLQLFSEKCF